MRYNIKISFQEPEYIVNESKGVVICNLTFVAEYPFAVGMCIKAPMHERPTYRAQKVKGVAYVRDNDSFDVTKGKKVSLAKAENQAYAYVRNQVSTAKRELVTALASIYGFDDKYWKVKTHNIEYMKKF